VTGNTVVWKPSEKTPLSAVAVTRLASKVLEEEGYGGVFTLLTGGREIGQRLAADQNLPLISATGSCAMGKAVATSVAGRLGRSLLELGGNNAVVVLEDADLDLAVRGVMFGAVGTAGQRCTTTRRLIATRGVARALEERLVKAFPSVPVGDPLEEGTLLGPLIDSDAVTRYEHALERARTEGGEIRCGGKPLDRPGYYVEPTLVRANASMPIVAEETFAPILYLLEVDDLDEAIDVHNSVEQGLSSSIFTSSVRSAERFLSATGSDCGIANVNLGTSGAEIGGAFGGEKSTGGGREAGSDSWKAYMRRQTCTINYSKELPLAQGVRFDI
jgi:aldehyde dehydrogenase (NAD+)